MMQILLALLIFSTAVAFQTPRASPSRSTRLHFAPLQELNDMLSNMDAVIDDFMNKRMGNGEVFYGKRKYKPSGRPHTEGRYNGMGLSDKGAIDIAREIKQEFLEKRKRRDEMKE
jgi:hypothetical protein